MSKNELVLSPRIKALKMTDLSAMIKMSAMMVPRLLKGFYPKLDEKQRAVVDKVLPVEGEKRFYIHLSGTPTPPIVVRLAQPLKISVMSEEKVKNKQIKGLVLSPEELQLAVEKRYGRLLWRIKGQLGVILSLAGLFIPFIRLGPKGLKDLQQKAMMHFKPVMDLMPGSKKY